MLKTPGRGLYRLLILLGLAGMIRSCTTPVSPEFEYIEGLVYIDALAATSQGASYATISRSALEYGINKSVFISGAEVTFVNTMSGQHVSLAEKEDAYEPPDDFAAKVGETWYLDVTLKDGTHYVSQPETIRNAVPISKIDVKYEPELFFSSERNRYAPGHEISVDFQDPPGEDNYYYWRFRSYESQQYCQVCYFGYYRDGACRSFQPTAPGYYTYTCPVDCWKIRFGEKIQIYSDQFTNGKPVQKLPIAEVLLYTRQNIAVEIQQFALSSAAFQYFKTLKDLIDNNAGLNAPLPAALIGNLQNPEDPGEYVLGRFTAAATEVSSVYIDRSGITEDPLEPQVMGHPEGPETGLFQVYQAPCSDGRYSTTQKPDGWPE
jgi:hypothetical protein